MPSPPSRPRRSRRKPAPGEQRAGEPRAPLGVGPRTRRRAPLGALLLALPLLAACATRGPAAPADVERRAALPAELRPYLVSPLEGWSGALEAERSSRLDSGWSALRAGDLESAGETAAELLAEEPNLPPAVVLAAQVELAEGRPRQAVERLAPLTAAEPGYRAAQLALGRAAELDDDPVAAYAAYLAVGDAVPVAGERVAEMRPRVLEILGRRVADAVPDTATPGALSGEALVRAQASLARLEAWAPGEAVTLRAARRLARIRGDRRAELTALRGLAPLAPDDRALAERRAELELEVGDPGRGLETFETLAERYPDDPVVAEGLANAKFRWRVAQMPPRVGTAATAPQLDRGGHAVLLYWLVPKVRYGRAGSARIASDILDDPRREEIARVANLDLISVDRSLHRFYPDRAITRGEVLASLLRLLAEDGAASCAETPGGADAVPGPCPAAAACGLLHPGEECLRAAPISGAEAVEWIRRAVERSGGR